MNVAVTRVSAVMVTLHVPVPLHPPPDQPANVEPEPGVAVRVTWVPLANPALHVCPQLMPVGLLVTEPVPVPALCTLSWNEPGADVSNVAVTDAAAVSVTVQAAVPVQAPDHPVNVEPEAGAAVSVTCVPLAKLALHVCPQSMPAGLLVTVPLPVPAALTVNGMELGDAVSNVAVTDESAERETVQDPVPLQAPDHPANVEPEAGTADKVTDVPLANPALHVVPQLIPAGVLVTVPVPVPALCTFNCAVEIELR